jgi:hypothetical protein
MDHGELEHLLDLGTVELVTERLHYGAQPVHARLARHPLRGSFVEVELGRTRLRLYLYRPTDRKPWWRTDGDPRGRSDEGPAFLVSVAAVDQVGWILTFRGEGGPVRYLGWLLECGGVRRASTSAAEHARREQRRSTR